MSKITIIEPNASDKDNVKAYMVKGERGDDGVSPTFETSKEGHVATITITDVEGTHTVELEDGQDGRDLTGGVPTNGVIGWTGNEIAYTCDGTETGDYYFTYDNTDYYFTMPTVEDGDKLIFNTDDLELSLDGTAITTSSTGAGTETELTFVDNIPNGYEVTDETFGGAQVVDEYSESTTDSYSANYVNGLRLKKLWENPSPTSAFDSQTITLSSDDYDYLIWIFRQYTTLNRQISVMALKGSGAICTVATDYNGGSGYDYYVASFRREVNMTDNKNFSIANCFVRWGNSTTQTQANDNLMPIAVYGGKF